MLFRIGEKVSHPFHGVGTVEQIEEKEVLGEKQKYYILNLFMKNMKVMIPVSRSEEIGLRTICSENDLGLVLDILGNKKRRKMSANWNRRYKENLEKIKSGTLTEVAEVYKNLVLRNDEKPLSAGEKRMMDDARKILLGEIMFSRQIAEEQASVVLDGAIH